MSKGHQIKSLLVCRFIGYESGQYKCKSFCNPDPDHEPTHMFIFFILLHLNALCDQVLFSNVFHSSFIKGERWKPHPGSRAAASRALMKSSDFH